ncbi:hypothetical protein THIOM_000556 [Candidatus Thiomargarita nelsonii]|uniref:Uncharacterized protein n=1 Tax=Candidatus Thiomargarita nelsonii TaxID=1003181 RepID=A0A176S6T2_9GAMM|nr:hypothetical protein THIOM_000556 [Candidatus Thiomargarita nelsonii]
MTSIHAEKSLWPSQEYGQSVQNLKAAVGQQIYIAEVNFSGTHLSMAINSTAFELLAVQKFPKPNPQTGLLPHFILLDDGRGINLGRIARISINTPFNPPADKVLYRHEALLKLLLSNEQRLTKEHISAISTALLKELLQKAGTEQSLRLKNALF